MRSPASRPNRSATTLSLPDRRSSTPCRVECHGVAAGQRHVDVILIRQERPVEVEDVDLSGRRGARVRLALVVRAERTLVGMGPCVGAGDARHGRVGEDERAVAGDQVAAVQALADQQGVVVRPIVVGDVDLVEPSAVPGEDERHAAHARLAARRRHPERGIGAAEEKLSARRRLGGSPRLGEPEQAARSESRHRLGEGRPALWQIYCVRAEALRHSMPIRRHWRT